MWVARCQVSDKTVRELDGQSFDVVVIGGGATGASTVQNLAARGYKALLVEKGDFASGTSSRSSRLLYCGLAHLSPDHPLWRFVLKPGDLLRRVYMARLALKCRTQLVNTMPERRSEEHTSELQSLMRISYAVFCLKKKKK